LQASCETTLRLRSAATVAPWGPANSDADFAQWAGVERDFTIAASSSVQAVTFSYGGGTNGSGAAIAAGGFEPYLSLFSSSGAFLASTYSGITCPSGAKTNPSSGQCFDVLLDAGVLAPGTYAIVISACENMSFAENAGTGTLGDGLTGLGNLTFGEDLHYAFDVNIQDTSPVPESNGAALIGVGGLLLVAVRRKIHEI
jgi:hypothetical protein